MGDKLRVNSGAVESYSKRVAKELLDTFFEGKNYASGQDLTTFCYIEQVNMFILYNLYDKWRQDVEKIRSPYFNYEEPAVRDAMKVFMNTVSMHIRVSKDVLRPVVEKAIAGTLILGLSPEDFFRSRWLPTQGMVKSEHFKQIEKYFKINKIIITSLIQRLQDKYLLEITVNEVMGNLKEVIEIQKTKLINPEELVSLFSKVVAVGIDEFMILNSLGAVPAHHNQTEIRHRASDLASRNRINDIKTNIGINQKFMFVNGLFKSNLQDFENAISEIDNSSSYDQAISILIDKYGDKYSWDVDNQQVRELFELIGRKFTH